MKVLLLELAQALELVQELVQELVLVLLQLFVEQHLLLRLLGNSS